MAELSAYEAKRRQRMEENRAALLALQIERLPAPKRPRRDVNKDAQPRGRRRSARLQELRTLTPAQRERARQLETRKQQYDDDSELPAGTKALPALPALPVTLLDLPVLDLNYSKAVVGSNISTRELDIRVESFHEHCLRSSWHRWVRTRSCTA